MADCTIHVWPGVVKSLAIAGVPSPPGSEFQFPGVLAFELPWEYQGAAFTVILTRQIAS